MKNKPGFSLIPHWELAPAVASPARSSRPGRSGPLGPRVLFAQGDDDRTVEAQRRRQSGESTPGGRERAEAPRRRQTGDEARARRRAAEAGMAGQAVEVGPAARAGSFRLETSSTC